jgi:hypothetical protein
VTIHGEIVYKTRASEADLTVIGRHGGVSARAISVFGRRVDALKDLFANVGIVLSQL